MAGLSGARDTKFRGTTGILAGDIALKMKASVTIYQGGLVVVDGTTGLAEPGSAAASKRVAGIALETKTSAASGATYVRVQRGVAKLANKAGDLVADALILADCTIEDDQTVRATAAGSSRAGKVIAIESDGVWVETF
jgi:hypothetical protein